MKLKFTLLLSIFCILLLSLSCTETDQVEESIPVKKDVTFSFSPDRITASSNAKVQTADINKILITIEDDAENIVETKKELTVVKFGDGYLTEPIALRVGNYNITEFLVVDADNKTLHATPITGSPLSHLVDQALPIPFIVTKDVIAKVNLEVVTVDDSTTPSDFGYTGFNFDITNFLSIYAASYVFDAAADAGFSFATSNITISGDGTELYSGTLEQKFNLIRLDTIASGGGTYTSYSVKVTKSGFNDYDSVFTHEQLKTFNSDPLSINLDKIAGWVQVGQTVTGSIANDWLNGGHLNNLGNILIAGTRRSNGANPSYVRIYEENSGTWQQLGNDITGPGSNFGNSFEINGTGDIVFLAAPEMTSVNGQAGGALAYEFDGSDWNQLGQTLIGDVNGDFFGSSISMNDAGDIVAVGAPENHGGENRNGQVKVFQNVSGTWTQIGQTLIGALGDRLGTRMSLNSAGNILAVSARTGDVGAFDAGQVHIYENVGGTWTQIGQTLAGNQFDESFGSTIKINAAGDIVLIGSPLKDVDGKNQAGQIMVFKNTGGTWAQIGQTLTGDVAEQGLGWYNAGMNDVGNIISVPSRVNSANPGLNTDRVDIFELQADEWILTGTISSGDTSDPLGGHAGLNAAGDRIAVGSISYSSGGLSQIGRAEVYELK